MLDIKDVSNRLIEALKSENEDYKEFNNKNINNKDDLILLLPLIKSLLKLT